MDTIKGGYVMVARKIDKSLISQAPPYAREIWLYLLRTANHKDNQVCKRGQTVRRYKDIQEALKWYVGYRKCMYSTAQCENSMKLLVRAGMIAKLRTTRGLLITVCNYDFYQNPKSYESQTHMPDTRATMEPQGRQTINNKGKKKDKKEKNKSVFPDNLNTPEFHQAWKDWIQYRTEIHHKLVPSTISRQLKMLAKHPVADAVGIIERSIQNSWQGLFPDRQTPKAKKVKLFPISGKTCSEQGCSMPAVYKNTGGDYDSYRCTKHLPLKVKELYD